MHDEAIQDTPTLIYHNFRGMAQTIRLTLFYLKISFSEVLLNKGQDPLALNILKNHKINGELELPCLVHQGHVIQDCFAIICYLCAKAKRQDLLGRDLEERTLVREIFYNFVLKKNNSIQILFKFGEKAFMNPSHKENIRKQAMLLFHKESGSLIQTAKLKLRNPQNRYVLSNLTILDFLFYEECFYQINLFGNLEEKNCKFLDTINSIFGTELSNFKETSTTYLRIMREFKENFQKQPFYLDNKQKLQSYTILNPCMNQNCRLAFRSVWLGPEHYVE